MSVILGATNLNSYDGTMRRVKSVTRHKAFDAAKLYNDIAILTLDYPVDFNNDIRPVCLPNEREYTGAGSDAVVLGWGNIYEGFFHAHLIF